jgi:hypothetical protein
MLSSLNLSISLVEILRRLSISTPGDAEVEGRKDFSG